MATLSKLLNMFIVLNMMICIQHLVVSGRRISIEEEEDIEIQEQLKILNKPPIKTIKMSDGEIVDCIDENKQPAFDHPMLKNHKIRSRPSSPPNDANRGASSSSSRKMVNLRRVKCPKGTVPIRRTSKEDLIRAKSFMESFEPIRPIIINPDEEVVVPPGRHDGGTGDWWFTMYGDINADFGYWPREVVPYLGTGATKISWGGLVQNTPHEISPPMGNGHFLDGDFKKVAAIYDMHFMDEDHNLTTPHVWKDFRIRDHREDCYRLTRNNYDDDHGFSVFFGGPGGNCD
ncbi:uncharacterized protein LOC113316245 [Papaver somniferum]|uniref:uncharacterized protein LOC113316245 n=1 Tax=Papaver somniferum TaxID=3469 RepID=UPI000E6FB5C2|nr:uncharacterized protein LOC113316245 [Papaver somniferum]